MWHVGRMTRRLLSLVLGACLVETCFVRTCFVGTCFVGTCFGVVACGAPAEREPVPVAVNTPSSGDSQELESETQAEPAEVEIPSDVARFAVPVAARPSVGPADAPVTIVIFSDFQCPFCSRALPTLERVRRDYGNQVRLVFRHNPLSFHQNARPAAMFAAEAFAQRGNEGFWDAHDLLFANQRSLEHSDLMQYAATIGLDVSQVQAALHNSRHEAAIAEDQALAQRIGARGTPNFFINGRQIQGAQPFTAFETVIDEELELAQQLIAAGIAPGELYERLIRDGRTEPAPPPEARRARPPRQEPDPDAVYRVVVNGQPQQGPDDALVTIVEFSDFECPFCGRVLPTLEAIRDQYGNDVRIVWMNNPLPFHRNAMPAAAAAHEVFRQRGNAGFWRFHEKLFENQRALTRQDLESYAQEQQVNMRQFRRALDSDQHVEAIEAQQEVARGLGAMGTPSFFINGRNVRGAQPLHRFQQVIDEELTKARQLVQQGTPRSRVYSTTIANGATSPQFVNGGVAATPAPAPPSVYTLAVPTNAPSRGAANARVVIQQFSDFQCPFCSRVEPTVDRVLQEYQGRVRLVWRDYPLPFHAQASLAAQAAREVFAQGGNRKFWQMHEKIFAGQRELSTPDGARAALERWAQQIGGINMVRFRRALDGEQHKEAIEADIAAVASAGARIGTPSFFINGRLLQGAQPIESFRDEINEALQALP